MSYQSITSDQELVDYCGQLASAQSIGIDTEFVAEYTYRPELCLLQVASEQGLAVIDPQQVKNLKPFWQLLVEGDHETVLHAGREELIFCLEAVGHAPRRLVDIQIAAGLIGLEYPANYGTLLQKLVGEKLQKGETRTDWRRRPLSQRQIEYALDDVRYLLPIRDALYQRLGELDRMHWLRDEMASWQADIERSRTEERWRKVSGSSGLSRRGLAIVRELWRWRQRQAETRDIPPRKILRDDLIVELARRQTDDPKRIAAIRGFDRSNLKRVIPELSEAIATALALADADLPGTKRRDAGAKLNLVGQFLSAALSSICRQHNLAPSIVGTASDVRDLVAYRLGHHGKDAPPPVLAEGWRAEVVGRVIEDLLEGRLAIRIENPTSEHPLIFEAISGNGG